MYSIMNTSIMDFKGPIHVNKMGAFIIMLLVRALNGGGILLVILISYVQINLKIEM